MPTKAVKSLHDRVEDVAFEPETDTGTPQTRHLVPAIPRRRRRSGPPLVREVAIPRHSASRCISQQPWTRPRLLPSSMLTTGPSGRIALVLLRSRLQVLAFLLILDQSHVTHCSVQLPILDPGLLLKGDDIVQDSSLCCFGSWVRRSLDVVANALDQESLLGAACPRVGWEWPPRCATA